MKVLYVLGLIPHYTHPLIEKMVAAGCEMIMLIPQVKDSSIGKGVKESEHSYTYRIRYSVSDSKWYGKPAIKDLHAVLKEEKPDILLIGWPYFIQLFFERSILRTLKSQGIKLIIQEIPFQVPPFKKFSYFRNNPVINEEMQILSRGISFYIRSFMTMIIRRFVYKRADASIAYASVAYDILPSYGIDKSSIFVRFNSSDTDSLMAEKDIIGKLPRMLDERPRILHIGRLVKWKRVDLLIDAFSVVEKKQPDSELVIIGDGPEKNALIDKAKKMGLAEKVNFVGGVYDSSSLGRYMHESTVYVLAGMGGLSINDAMCFSLPVIVSVCDGTEKDLITDGVNGFFFREGDATDLASKIGIILSDSLLANKMGLESFNVIKNKINLNTVCLKYLEAFRYVLNK